MKRKALIDPRFPFPSCQRTLMPPIMVFYLNLKLASMCLDSVGSIHFYLLYLNIINLIF